MELHKVYKKSRLAGHFNICGGQACFLCGETSQAGTDVLCPGCLQDLPGTVQYHPPHPGPAPHDVECLAALTYEYPVNCLVRGLKYHRHLEIAKALGLILARHVLIVSANLPDCLVPVPLHPARYRQRGYNQATLIARAAGRLLQIPVLTGLVQRTRNTQAQFDLPPVKRRTNVRNAFISVPAPACHSIAIVDDVMTTGATMEEVARALKRAGVDNIQAWACARAPRS